MKVKLLGTGAADFLPSLKDTNRYTVDIEIRRSTCTLIDETLLIDCGPHLLDEIKLFGGDITKMDNILLTHYHGDHINKEVLTEFVSLRGKKVNLWYNEEIAMPEIEGVILKPIKIQQEFEVDGFKITALAANHNKGAVHYSIEKDDKKIFYGCDGAWLLMDTFYFMKDKGYDMMIMDATMGNYDGDWRVCEHNSIPMVKMLVKSFKSYGVTKEDTKIVLDHLARTLHRSYEITQEAVKDEGFIIGYDGLELEV